MSAPAESPVEAPLTDRELATHLLAVAALLDRVKAVDTRLRAEAKRRMTVGDRVTGILDPADPKTRIGTVTMAEGSEYVAVKNSAAFFAWVLENHPDEVESILQVKPVFQTAVLNAVKRDGLWNFNPETGEGEAVPGVEVTVGDPKPVVKKNDDAVRLVGEAIAAGKLKAITS